MEEAQTLFTNLGLNLAFQFGHVTAAPAGFTAALNQFVSLFGDTAGELHSSFFGALGITAQSYYTNTRYMMGAYTFFSGTKYNLQTSISFCCHFSDDHSGIYRGSYLVKTTAVPEPGTLFLLGLGLVGIGFVKRKNV
ncbi:MAG: PEP-CTERM sorting domain-containing protein [Gammaproteobacteria bacterium]|nr:PEP-CTERM sorting domain-containing protein [Gammaproteobacteria bacterium]